jgi:hypothetical protein
MKKTSTLAPLLIGSLVAMLQFTSAPQARAFGGAPGGPFSNGSYFPNDGTFSAVIRGTNLVGTAQFSTTSSSVATGVTTGTGVGSTGVSVIYNEGQTYSGNSNGVYDPASEEMIVMFQGVFPGQGQQSYQTVVPGNSNFTQVKYYDSFYINGSAICQVSNDFPNQTFKGEGQVNLNFLNFDSSIPSLQGNDQTLVESGGSLNNPNYSNRTGYNKYFKKINVTGVRVSNNSSSFSTSTIVQPSINQYLGLPR